MRATDAILAAGAGVAATVLFRGTKRAKSIRQTPAQVSADAARELGGISAPGKDYSTRYVAQKDALRRQFGSDTEYMCGSGFFDVCLPEPGSQIPTASRDATRRAATEWMNVATSVLKSDDTFGEIATLLKRHRDALVLMLSADVAGGGYRIGVGATRLDPDSNRRVWYRIGQIALLLQGVLINHGDIRIEARKELLRTVTDPAEYAKAAADGAGAGISLLAQIVGKSAANVIASNLGPILVIGAATYFVVRRST